MARARSALAPTDQLPGARRGQQRRRRQQQGHLVRGRRRRCCHRGLDDWHAACSSRIRRQDRSASGHSSARSDFAAAVRAEPAARQRWPGQARQPRQSGQPSQGATQALRNGFNLPPPGETRFVPNEVMLDIPSSVPTATLDAIAARHRMTRLETQTFRLTGRTLHRWRLDGGGTVAGHDPRHGRRAADRGRAADSTSTSWRRDTAARRLVNGDQYAPEKLGLPEAHRLATGNRVLVAVIDSGVDADASRSRRRGRGQSRRRRR